MQRCVLNDGGWVDLRSQEEITTRGRRGIQAIAATLGAVLPKLQGATKDTPLESIGLTEEQTDAVLRLQEATVVAFLAGWSRPDPLPTIATVGDLPASLFDELAVLTAPLGAESASMVLDTSPGDGPDPKGLSGGSGNSDGPSRDAPAPTPTLTSSTGGAASNTGS